MTKLTREQIEQIVKKAWRKGKRPNLNQVDLSQTDLFGVTLRGADLSEANMRGANLRWANLRGANLSGVDLNKADLSGANLTGANLIKANLRQSNLIKANLFGAHLFGAYLNEAHLNQANLIKANLFGANLREAYLQEVNLSGAHLSGAYLIGAHLDRANLSGAYLIGAYLMGAHFQGAYLSEARLSGANLRGADLRGVNLFEADLRVANLLEANLGKANLSGANLSGANLSQANLNQADLFGVNLSGANLDQTNLNQTGIGWTIFGDIDLSQAKSVETVRHRGPSTIGLDTLIKSRGKIPVSFLQGCGLSDLQIEIAQLHNPKLTPDQVSAITQKINQLHTDQTSQHHACFISYSAKDQVFAQQLYHNLQENGIRCWHDPEDLRTDQTLYPQIDQAIRAHNKLLLILSKDSLNSEWVKVEIQRTRQTEIRDNQQTLFPIRLVDMKTIETWQCLDTETGDDLAIDVREYDIFDFSVSANNEDAYQQAFTQLANDLKSNKTPPLSLQGKAQEERMEGMRLQLARHHDNLNQLREKAIAYGPDELPPKLLNRIKMEQKTITEIETGLDIE